jgi:histidyl-tRNA synthetase
VTHHCGGGSFKSQMKRADGSGAPVAVIVGDDEANAREASVKPLREDRDQKRVPLDELPAVLTDTLYVDETE